MEHVQQPSGFRVADMIEDGLRLFPSGDEAFVAKLRKVLRKRRLAKADPLLQLADRELALNSKMAQHQQPAVIRHRFQQRHGLFGIGGKASEKGSIQLDHSISYP